MAHTVKIDFYTVEMPNGAPEFRKLAIDDSKTADDETRNVIVGGYPVRLQNAHPSQGIVEAEMLRIQMSDLPAKAKLSGKVGNLDLDEDEGIGGETAFLYDTQHKVLVLQRNKSGVTANMLSGYFQAKGGVAPIVLRPVIQADAIKRLAAMKETRRLKVRLAGITNPAFFRSQGSGLGEMVDILEFFRAPSATFEMSMGHQSGSLWAQKIVALAKKVVNLPTDNKGEVSTMEVSGILDDDSRDVFDVLAYRMVEIVQVATNEHRRSSYKKRRPEIKQAWERRKDELASMFGS